MFARLTLDHTHRRGDLHETPLDNQEGLFKSGFWPPDAHSLSHHESIEPQLDTKNNESPEFWPSAATSSRIMSLSNPPRKILATEVLDTILCNKIQTSLNFWVSFFFGNERKVFLSPKNLIVKNLDFLRNWPGIFKW
jgi:hypothetical protein